MKVGDVRDVVVYAYYKDAAPKKVDNAELTLSADGTALTYAAGKVTGAAAGNGYVKAVVTAKPALETAKSVAVSEN